MKPELYYKHKEFIDTIISTKLGIANTNIVIINNEIYIKLRDNFIKHDSSPAHQWFKYFDTVFSMIDDDDFYIKIISGNIPGLCLLNPMDIYYYYNIKKLKDENNKIKELLKNKID